MISTPQAKKGLFLASSLCDGVEDNNIKQVKTLLDNNEANPNVIIPIYGITPFHLAVGNSSESFAEEVIKLFLRHGGDPNIRSTEGLTPVHIAAAWGRCRILELLLSNGGDPLLLDKEGYNPFHFAFDGAHYDAVNTLRKYCGDFDDKEEENKYDITLEKLFINNKNVIAEYVISDENSTETINISPENFLEVNIKSKDYTSTSGSQINFNDNFVTRRKPQKILKRDQENENTSNQMNTDFCVKTVEDEKLLVSQIINKLSTSLSNDITKTDIDNNSSLFERRMGFMPRLTNPQNRGRKLNQPTKPTLPYRRGRLKNNSKEEQTPVKFASTQRSEKPGTKSSFFKTDATFSAVDNSIVSKSPNCNILSRFEKKKKNEEKVSTIDRLVLKSSDDSIISKSPNCNIVSTLERKRKLVKTPSSEKNMTPKLSKKPLLKMISRTPCDMKSKLFKLNSEKVAQVSKSLPRNFHRACTKTAQERKSQVFKKPISVSKKVKSTKNKDMEESSGVYSKLSKISNFNNLAVKLEDCMFEEFNSLSDNNDAQSTRLSENFDHEILISMTNAKEKYLNSSLENGTCQLSNDSISRCNFEAKRPQKIVCIKSEKIVNHDSRFSDSTLDCKSLIKSNLSNESSLSIDLKFNNEDKIKKIENITGKGNNESLLTDDLTQRSFLNRPGSESFVSIEEEYKYKDPEEGVILLERRHCITPSCVMIKKEEFTSFYTCSTAESVSSLPQEMLLIDKHTLRQKLTDLGETPGPITNSTHRVYLKRLMKLEEKNKIFKNDPPSLVNHPKKLETNLIKASLLSLDCQKDLEIYKTWESQIFLEFARPDPSRRWREGLTKASFNYLLLDSRITQNLPNRAANLSLQEKWETFLSAIFYVGKGKRSRPYAHLYDAFHTWVSKKPIDVSNKKIKRILEIWNEKQGVVVLHVFQNTIPVEAYTREAAMIDALGVEKLGNCKAGEYYGKVATWSNKEKCDLGKYLLYKAMEILMVEGERHLFPEHL